MSKKTLSGIFAFNRLIIPLICLLIGGVIGYFMNEINTEEGTKNIALSELREGGYKFINPLLECDSSADFFKNKELRPFKAQIEDFIVNKIDKKWAQDMSVYFRELNDGLWFSIGDTEKFAPASLLKVPLTIALLKEAETDNKFLSKKIRFSKKNDLTEFQTIKPSQQLIPNHEYTVDELIYRMIAYSDNNAKDALKHIVDPPILSDVYHDFGLSSPYQTDAEQFVSAQDMAMFFRTLFNASYLGREMSEKALGYLSKTEFKTGIVAGVPKDIQVAHKFGERWFNDKDIVQLHDCGIIYYPKHPYLLCIMTSGKDIEYLDSAIAEISRIMYTHVDEQHGYHP